MIGKAITIYFCSDLNNLSASAIYTCIMHFSQGCSSNTLPEPPVLTINEENTPCPSSSNIFLLTLILLVWLVSCFGNNTTLTAKVISSRSVTHMCYLAFSHQYRHNSLSKATTTFLPCFCRDERRKYARKKVCLTHPS